MINISINEACIFEKLLIENRDSGKLQRFSDCSYIESIEILNKLRKKLGR